MPKQIYYISEQSARLDHHLYMPEPITVLPPTRP